MMMLNSCASVLTLALVKTLVIGILYLELVSAFSPPGPHPNPNKIQTERNYGHHLEAEISVAVSSPLVEVAYPDTTFERGIASGTAHFGSMTALSLNKIAFKSRASRKRERERMVRPKSLNSKIPTSDVKKSKYPEMLSHEKEGHLASCIRKLRLVVRIRDDLVASHRNPQDTEMPWQPSETEWAVACGMSVLQLRKVMHEGQEARTELVDANGGLVRSIAKKHYWSVKQANQAGGGLGSILTLQDLVQEGNLGLMEAAERFDPERGYRFSTYATYWVRQRILRSISESSRVIRLPAHVHSMVRKIYKAKKEMEKEIGRTPSVPELAHYLETSVEKVRLYTDSSRTVLSLELPVNMGDYKDEDKRTLGDRIASDSPTPEEDAQVESLRRDIRDVVNELPARERDVLVARFGLDDGTPKSVEETSKRIGISRDRVRLVEARALNKLRHPQRNYKLKDYVGGADTEDEHAELLNMSPERIWSF